ncbi:unnamed protein product [Medioppia subpectinata]|uniref:Uncharacterized protein n=1 Tax=Medioppia subpectinata TaxID=1979941 RepID=A0A7R9KGZ5_9ACAR|nr:unnamed protein product [Medioppia subpectinata]CAG2103374.1 unnamed protein product [Medioppia subpectinata]
MYGEVGKLLCDAEKVDTDKVTKVVECLNNFKNKRSADMKALEEKVEKSFHKECTGKAGDMSQFKKVDLTKHDLKQMLIKICDEVEKATSHSEWEKLNKCALDVLKK